MSCSYVDCFGVICDDDVVDEGEVVGSSIVWGKMLRVELGFVRVVGEEYIGDDVFGEVGVVIFVRSYNGLFKIEWN